MIKQKPPYGEIETTALEVGDKFVMLNNTLSIKEPLIHLTVSKINKKNIVAVSFEGKEYRFRKDLNKSFCYANKESVSKKLLEAFDSWKNIRKNKNVLDNRRSERD